jgi:acetyltransferase-like isoleucine patch superfamily enzyme
MMKLIGKTFLFAHRGLSRIWAKCFSVLISGAFAQFGRQSVLTPPLRLRGEERIAIGEEVFLGSGCWLQAVPDGENRSVAISIGNGTSLAGNCVISAVRSVSLAEHVLLARNVYISDHIHEYAQTGLPILSQGVTKIQPVQIGQGAWLGQNVVICPGVTVGRGAVIGANSVVNTDIPDFSVAVGSPARVVKMIEVASR